MYGWLHFWSVGFHLIIKTNFIGGLGLGDFDDVRFPIRNNFLRLRK